MRWPARDERGPALEEPDPPEEGPNQIFRARTQSALPWVVRCPAQVISGLSLHYAISPLPGESRCLGCVSRRCRARLLALHSAGTADLLTCTLPTACLPEHLPVPVPIYSASCTPTASLTGPQLCRGHVCSGSSKYCCVYLCSCTTCDLNTLLAAFEIGGAEKSMLQPIPPPSTNPLACCAVPED